MTKKKSSRCRPLFIILLLCGVGVSLAGLFSPFVYFIDNSFLFLSIISSAFLLFIFEKEIFGGD